MRKLILAAASVAALALAGPASAQSPIVIKFSHVVASNTPKGAAAEKFKELAEKYTDGKVKVEVYPNSTLYKDKEELEALQLGAVQMLAPSNSKFGPIGVREFEVFDLPYILPDLTTLRKVTDGPLGARLLKLLDAKGFAKLGGHQRDGTVAVDRYISYRRGNGTVTLGVWLLKDAPIEDHEFHVSAPATMIEGGKSFAEVRPGISEKDAQETRHIRAFKDLPSAAAAFDAALAKITA